MITKQTISDLRTARGWSQGKLAEELGVDQATVSRMERGGFISRPVGKVLERLLSETPSEDAA
ncbi:helix-turn-helix domain-containing protein [Brucella sp. HL-2]|nr:helix-turn-helix transcriptional regulator [Brucella sp. HL-2]MCV9909700.1 helix-turn-helix domain-containing protein [Brucella sp. HL-2]